MSHEVSSTAVLRALVVTEVVLLVATVLTAFIPAETPPAVDEYLEGARAGPLFRLDLAESTTHAYVLGGLLFAYFVLYLASVIGLLCLKPWARRLYVISFVIGACTYPFLGSSIVNSVTGTIDYLAAICTGAILATLYLSDAKTNFQRTPVHDRAHGGSPRRTD